MNWKVKARAQDVLSTLPQPLSFGVHYIIQRLLGDLRTVNPTRCLKAGIAVADRIERCHRDVQGKTFIEIGTGRRLELPIALWLCGASRVVTIDLNSYLAPGLVRKDILFIKTNRDATIKLFGKYAERAVFAERLERLIATRHYTVESLFALMNIEYLAPADATRLDLPDHSIDYHVSNTVLEHVPAETIYGIMREGMRILRPHGLFVHRIDLSDHFSHFDRSITAVNFLQYNEREWHRYAGNLYTYHNRLRVDEISSLLIRSGLRMVSLESEVDGRSLEQLKNARLKTDDRFRNKSEEINATIGVWVTASCELP